VDEFDDGPFDDEDGRDRGRGLLWFFPPSDGDCPHTDELDSFFMS